MIKTFTPKRILLGLIILFLALILYFYLPVFMPLILAFFTALMLEPLIKLTQKLLRQKTRLTSVIVVFLLFVCFISTITYLTVTKLISDAIGFVDRLPYYIVEFNYYLNNLLNNIQLGLSELPQPIVEGINLQIQAQSEFFLKKGQELAGNVVPTLVSWAQSIPNLIVVLIIYLITLFLISMDLPQLKEKFYNLFTEENEKKVRFMTKRLSNVFVGFFKAQFLVSIVIFIVSYIGLLIIEPSNALIMAIIIWIIDVIPFIGSIIVLAPWALFHLVTGDPATGLKLLILAGILLVIRRTLEPMIMGEHIGLSPLSTLISIYLGLYFFGIIGLIAGPLFIIALKSSKEAGIIIPNIKI